MIASLSCIASSWDCTVFCSATTLAAAGDPVRNGRLPAGAEAGARRVSAMPAGTGDGAGGAATCGGLLAPM